MKGPGIFLAQFAGDEHPYNSLETLAEWASGLGYRGLQVPTWDRRLIDLELAATSDIYCSDIIGMLAGFGLQITELSTHLQGQLVAVHPAYSALFSGFAPKEVRNNPEAQRTWAENQLKLAAKASARLGLKAHATFSGALAWPYFYPWPQRPPGLLEGAFRELAARWRPLLDQFDECGVDLCYEIHPGEDLHDGVSFETFLEYLDGHPRCCILYDPSHLLLQQIDYVGFIEMYHQRIRAFHVKDAEFNQSAKCGVYGGYRNWSERPGRFRSLGDGQIDFGRIFSQFSQHGYSGWAVLEWECALKDSEQGAREGAPFIVSHMITPATKSFDDFADANMDNVEIMSLLGIRAP